MLQPEPRKVDTRKFVHEFRAATLECNAGQNEVALILTLFYKSYIIIICVIQFDEYAVNNNV